MAYTHGYDTYVDASPSGELCYFLRVVGTNKVKIGKSTRKNLGNRISAIQTGHPEELELVVISPVIKWKGIKYSNGLYDERWWQKVFRKNHYRGEWYLLSETDINEVIRDVLVALVECCTKRCGPKGGGTKRQQRMIDRIRRNQKWYDIQPGEQLELI